MATIHLDEAKCIGCGSCVDACPAGMYQVSGDKAKVVKDMSECLGCHACESACPQGAIKIED